MSLIEIQDFNIVAVYVDDLAEAVKFYTEILGFRKDFDMDPGVCLKIENVLSIYLEGGYSRKDPEQKTAQVSFCLFPAGGIRNAWQKIKESPVKKIGEYSEFENQFAMFRIADPAGNIIEFAGKP
ncbi:MAG: VOC family protein [Candidatus Rifleibacteriota bacterium]